MTDLSTRARHALEQAGLPLEKTAVRDAMPDLRRCARASRPVLWSPERALTDGYLKNFGRKTLAEIARWLDA